MQKNLNKLIQYVEDKNYVGYDIYDGLTFTNSKFLLKNYVTNTFFTQLFKKNPINLRPFFGIESVQMPKAMGLFLSSYCLLAKNGMHGSTKEEYTKKSQIIFEWLINNSLTTYSGPCWNFGFNYKFMFDKPTVVITSIIVKGLMSFYKLTQNKRAKEIITDIGNFIIHDLHQTETKYGLCFSYTPIKKDCCYNANMLAAETLAKIYYITKNDQLLEYIIKALDFTLAYQKDEGYWNYSIQLQTGTERHQIDFHQGYILESLFEIIKYINSDDKRYRCALKKGAEFYFKEQFFVDGRSKWRLPKVWPIDIHNQAQGIITFCKLKALCDEYLPCAQNIAQWTIENMQDFSGYFYYQKHRFYTNKIPYMRWSQAWMMLALSELVVAGSDKTIGRGFNGLDGFSPI